MRMSCTMCSTTCSSEQGQSSLRAYVQCAYWTQTIPGRSRHVRLSPEKQTLHSLPVHLHSLHTALHMQEVITSDTPSLSPSSPVPPTQEKPLCLRMRSWRPDSCQRSRAHSRGSSYSRKYRNVNYDQFNRCPKVPETFKIQQTTWADDEVWALIIMAWYTVYSLISRSSMLPRVLSRVVARHTWLTTCYQSGIWHHTLVIIFIDIKVFNYLSFNDCIYEDLVHASTLILCFLQGFLSLFTTFKSLGQLHTGNHWNYIKEQLSSSPVYFSWFQLWRFPIKYVPVKAEYLNQTKYI